MSCRALLQKLGAFPASPLRWLRSARSQRSAGAVLGCVGEPVGLREGLTAPGPGPAQLNARNGEVEACPFVPAER